MMDTQFTLNPHTIQALLTGSPGALRIQLSPSLRVNRAGASRS